MHMKKILLKFKSFIFTRKKTSILILIVLAGAIYFAIQYWGGDSAETRYIIDTANSGEITTVVSGTGQVSSLDQVDVTTKTSGDIVYLNAKAGQAVTSGFMIGQIDSSEATYELESAKISYEDLVFVDVEDIAEAEKDLEDAYSDAHAALTSALTDMTDVVTGVNDLLDGYLDKTNSTSLKQTSRDNIDKAEDSYYKARNELNDLIKKYRTVSISTPKSELSEMVRESHIVSLSVAQSAKFSQDAVVYMRDKEEGEASSADNAYSNVIALVSKANSVVSSLSSTKSSITDNERNLKDLKEGPDVLDVRSSQLSVQQKQEALYDHYVRAPFDGIIASVNVKKGERVSSGTTVVTLITKQKIAEISLNEVDVAKVKVGQKAFLTLDVIEDLKIEGRVAEIDLIGTISQGVVNYTVKIDFAVDDDRVKPGMTITAEIVTESKPNVIAVPISAVQTRGNTKYIEVVDEKENVEVPKNRSVGVLLQYPPKKVNVETGISNDEMIEIISGLVEGEKYILKTITGTLMTPTASASSPSLFGGSTRTGSGGFPR